MRVVRRIKLFVPTSLTNHPSHTHTGSLLAANPLPPGLNTLNGRTYLGNYPRVKQALLYCRLPWLVPQRVVPRLTDDTRHEVAGQESNKVGQQPGGGERNEAGKWAAAPLEAADVNHLTEWAAPNCKEIMEAEL